MWLCITTRSDGWTGDFSADLVPPLLHSIRLSEKKIMLIWFSAKLLQSSSTHQNPAKPLSDAFFGMALRRDDVSSVRFLDRPANNQKKVKQLRKYAKNGNKTDPVSYRSMQCCRFDRLRTYNIFKLLWNCIPVLTNWIVFWFEKRSSIFQNMNEIIAFVYDASF